ncbi:uncharacterized protein DSM5745_06134 [Aspergillus mulundensis]|uniref:Uncharacterized protein n=1 Tax=Aspergillus mulundensis TaxID=1810919 RepID=A0A3D8RZ18_9EURO|nr:hypothetical protein DSM5745_06134 [Aspergillus mulundensis]RDW79282.1 hypothetical protein DSM5745_06134 [Aspergillus mulundensis]
MTRTSCQPGNLSQVEPVKRESNQGSTSASSRFYRRADTSIGGEISQAFKSLSLTTVDHSRAVTLPDCGDFRTLPSSNLGMVNQGMAVSLSRTPDLANRRKQKSILRAARPSVNVDMEGDVIMSDASQEEDEVKYRRSDWIKNRRLLADKTRGKAVQQAGGVRDGGLTPTRRVQKVHFSKSGSTFRYLDREYTPLQVAQAPEHSVMLPVAGNKISDMATDDGLADIL